MNLLITFPVTPIVTLWLVRACVISLDYDRTLHTRGTQPTTQSHNQQLVIDGYM